MDEINKLMGAAVNFVRFGSQIDINFIDSVANLQIEVPFQLKAADETVDTIDLADVDTLSPLLKILHAKVSKVELKEDSTLSIIFDNGIELVVKAAQRYEAWNLRGDGIPYLVAAPLEN